MIGPTDLLHPSPAPHCETFHVFLNYCPKQRILFPNDNKHAYPRDCLSRIIFLLTGRELRQTIDKIYAEYFNDV
jgi:hypothetical protein